METTEYLSTKTRHSQKETRNQRTGKNQKTTTQVPVEVRKRQVTEQVTGDEQSPINVNQVL